MMTCDFSNHEQKKLFFTVNGQLLNEKEPILLQCDDENIHKQWYPIIAMNDKLCICHVTH